MQFEPMKICFALLVGVLTLGWLPPVQGGDLDAGKVIHEASCLKCHGAQGNGDGPASKLLKDKPSDWTDAEMMSEYADADLMKLIKEGGVSVGKSKLMPAFGKKLDDQQIQDVIAFIRSLAE